MFNPPLLSRSFLNTLFISHFENKTDYFMLLTVCSKFQKDSSCWICGTHFYTQVTDILPQISPRALQWVSKMCKHIRKIRMDQLHVGTEIPKLGNFPLFTRHSKEYTSLKFCSRSWTSRPPELIKLQNLFIIWKWKWKSLSHV